MAKAAVKVSPKAKKLTPKGKTPKVTRQKPATIVMIKNGKPQVPKPATKVAKTANSDSARIIASRQARGLKHVHVFLDPKDHKRLTSLARKHTKPHSEILRMGIRSLGT